MGDPRRRTVPVPRGGWHRMTTDATGQRWLTVRTWYGRIVYQERVTGYW